MREEAVDYYGVSTILQQLIAVCGAAVPHDVVMYLISHCLLSRSLPAATVLLLLDFDAGKQLFSRLVADGSAPLEDQSQVSTGIE